MKTLSDKVKDYKLNVGLKNAQLRELFIGSLAEEYLAWYFYTTIGSFLYGHERPSVEKFFGETADDELNDHGKWLIKRMDELDMSPIELFDPSSWNKYAFHPYEHPEVSSDGNINTKDALLKALNMESEAIETYTIFEEKTRDSDPVTNQKIKEILADEQEHLTELKNFWQDIEEKERN